MAIGFATMYRVALAALFVFVSFGTTEARPPARAAWPSPETGSRAMVASAHGLASDAGRAMFAAGGNAVDAAVAMSFAISVVEPWGSGLGGGAFAVVGLDGEVTTFDMREMAPSAAHRDMFVKDGAVVAGESIWSARAAGIPGLVRGMAALHKRYGKLPFAQVVAPAIALARDGFPVSARFREAIRQVEPQMNDAARAIFAPGGKVPAVGTMLRQADLAATLERIAATGGEDFYTGRTAEMLVASVVGEGGIWTPRDLAAYEVKERTPVRGVYRGYDIVSMAPPSSGGLLLVQMLSALERLPIFPWRGADAAHQLAEVMKRAFAMRALGLGDPDHVEVDVSRFIGTATIDRIVREVRGSRRATPAARLSPLKVRGGDRVHTSHLAAVDADGNGVAITQTINLRFGNGRVAAGTGVMLNNEMDDFSAMVGVPNAFGLVGDAGNAIAAGKRPLSSMTPTLVLKDGKVMGAFGSPGGSRIISTTLQTLLRVIDDGLDASAALGAERLHHQWYPDELQVEAHALSPETKAALVKRGHRVRQVGDMGNAMVIWRRGEVLEGAADPRGEGAARGW